MNRPSTARYRSRYRLATVVAPPRGAIRYSGCPLCHTGDCTRWPGEYWASVVFNALASGIVLPSNSLITSPGLSPALSAGDPIITDFTFAPQIAGADPV